MNISPFNGVTGIVLQEEFKSTEEKLKEITENSNLKKFLQQIKYLSSDSANAGKYFLEDDFNNCQSTSLKILSISFEYQKSQLQPW